MIAPFSDVQKGFFDILTAALAPVTVHDDHPTNHVFPYVTIGVLDGLPDELLVEQGAEISMQVDVWSQQHGMKETQQLMEQIVEALHHKQLPLTTSQWVDTAWETSNVVAEPDGRTRHGVLRFTVWTFAGIV